MCFLGLTQVEVVISLLPPSCHSTIADACIKLKRHLITASYVDDSMSKLDEAAKSAGIAIIGEMGLDPGIVGIQQELYELGAIRPHTDITGRFYMSMCELAGENLYDSAISLRIPDLPAFALECLPNRNSLIYGDLYGIGHEAATIFRGTLRYEGMIST
ncbi:hypothetical protein RJ639_009319 [Escallonia herrerae]|uniref:Uncharacterized protein n=1 Tax=Escallonia herrerae TaxID=1293975 RepID=A0AA88VQT7_9ASTE|nr:hypothetical protein RJ639_009319 [Escallonia herrerae]